MTNTAFVFPGQGSQYVGMGKEIASEYKEAQEIFNAADTTLGFKISDICFNGPDEKLQKTLYTQPALLAASIACYKVLEKKGLSPDYVAGHSIGEYAALVVAESISFEDAINLVYKRGQYMEEAVPDNKGAMAAILGMSFEDVESVCEEASTDSGSVQPANMNCPGQVVIAGETNAVQEAMKIAGEKGAKKTVQLKVSGPFHSSLMYPAAEKMGNELEKVSFKDPIKPVVTNYSAKIIGSGEELKTHLKKQIDNPVLWDGSVRVLLENNVDSFVEVGPGKVLSGLIKKIHRKSNIANVEDTESLNKTLEKWGI